MKKIIFIAVIITIITPSCAHRNYLPSSSFVSVNPKDLDGKYLINREDLYEFFNVKADDYKVSSTRKFYGAYQTAGDKLASANEEAVSNHDFIILGFNGRDSLNIVYRDNDFWYKTSYKGKWKNNFFEISLQKKRLPFFPLFVRYDVDRIRIGVNSDKKLLVYNYSEHWGMFLLFGAHSGGDEYSITLDRIE
ncbi:MAG TPA: hypothetical protein DIT04_01000 [Dysgonomonas sp.]|nr:hypothetical protein [Dysgonomonas sp.]